MGCILARNFDLYIKGPRWNEKHKWWCCGKKKREKGLRKSKPTKKMNQQDEERPWGKLGRRTFNKSTYQVCGTRWKLRGYKIVKKECKKTGNRTEQESNCIVFTIHPKSIGSSQWEITSELTKLLCKIPSDAAISHYFVFPFLLVFHSISFADIFIYITWMRMGCCRRMVNFGYNNSFCTSTITSGIKIATLLLQPSTLF